MSVTIHVYLCEACAGTSGEEPPRMPIGDIAPPTKCSDCQKPLGKRWHHVQTVSDRPIRELVGRRQTL